MVIRKQLIDQSAHFLIALAVVLIVSQLTVGLGPLAGAVIGLALGVTREVTEGGNVLSRGSVLDMAFWTLGGLLGGIL